MPHPPEAPCWSLYMLRCGDGTLYTGISPDVPARLEAHRLGQGARYTRGRGPLALIYLEACGDRSTALRREYAVKRLTRPAKEALASTWEAAAEAEAPAPGPQHP